MIDAQRYGLAAQHYQEKIAGLGLKLVTSTDFEELERHSKDLGRKVTPHFSTKENTFFVSEAFWVGLFDEKGACVATIACKVQPLGAESLVEYSAKYWKRIYPKQDAGPVQMGAWQKRAMQEMRGTLVYSGEYFVSEDWRKSGVGTFLAGYIKPFAFTAFDRHQPQLFYIFMEKKDAEKGLFTHIGLTHQVENAWNFAVAPSADATEYQMGWIGREQLNDDLDRRFDLYPR